MNAEKTTPFVVPSLYTWAGGQPALERLTAVFYAKVAQDELLAPLFSSASHSHAIHVAHFLTEVLGGPPLYTAGDGGSHAQMVMHHLGRHLSEIQRRRWLNLLLDSADEAGLPTDPEFRAALVGYLEWGSRLAVLNSQDGAPAPDPAAGMPQWGWGEPGGPYQPPS
ncbi:group II truncated hemoglobin [Hymenobacter negativus]|uniref:Group II truncated hemoglobin n=1 Tax=Hymenobacter negativus TaxID=2795026 RepID=A0ABS3QJ20_9BACT|nr:group II truncated hemoglobin [Hymenobacter negativus]MBO2011246.1 group II truncated hemoglobin [Hymenobacter negativus]